VHVCSYGSDEQFSHRTVKAEHEVHLMLSRELKRKRTDDFEVEELAVQLVAKLEELIGTTASREFTCLGVVFGVPEAQELMHMTAADLRSQIALVEHDLTAYRSI